VLTDGAVAQTEYPVRMRVELLSIRNRSGAPIPVQIKMEYNQTQILEGDLELSFHDALDVVNQEGLMATLKIEDLVLSGGDLIFNTILPPMQTSGLQNLAIMGYFRTEKELIPLSSSPKETNPPRPHDLLMISPSERASLLCSCTGATTFQSPSANKIFLDTALSLENYNPLKEKDEPDAETRPRNSRSFGKNIQFYSSTWSSRDLPEDPLSYCSFDIVLLVDGAFAKLTTIQMSSLLSWVKAGGSVCIVPDSSLKPQHLDFVRNLFEQSGSQPDPDGTATPFTLDDDGQLLTVTDNPSEILLGRPGLGRAALLPATDSLKTELSPEQLGRLVAHLWKVKKNIPVWQGKQWGEQDLVEQLRRRGLHALHTPDGRISIEYSSEQQVHYRPEQLRDMFGLSDEDLAPNRDPLVTVAGTQLVPSDVEMVPTWMIGLILAAYVLTIGPVDYLVLGFFRLRKATWILFPLVTAGFTILTIWIAHWYMGSKETGGSIEITDIVDEGVPARRSRIQMLFYGSRATHSSEHKQQLLVPVTDPMLAGASMSGMFGADESAAGSTPILHYSGHFPGSYSVSQVVQQWSPTLMRTFELQPKDADVPFALDWSDTSLLTTPEGQRRLTAALEQVEVQLGGRFHAAILHQDQSISILRTGELSNWSSNGMNRGVPGFWPQQYGQNNASIPATLINSTSSRERVDFFRLVAQVSPEGSGLLEDLSILDPTDETQWVLVIIQSKAADYRVWRKLYHIGPNAVRPNAVPVAEKEQV
jgi:hypothetical protein